MEYATIINELQDLLDRSRDCGGEDIPVYIQEEAIEGAIEAIQRLMDLES